MLDKNTHQKSVSLSWHSKNKEKSCRARESPTQSNNIPRKTPACALVHLLFTICVPKSEKSPFQYFVLSLALVRITG